MMKYTKHSIFFVIMISILIFSITAISANDINSNNTIEDNVVSTPSVDSTNTIEKTTDDYDNKAQVEKADTKSADTESVKENKKTEKTFKETTNKQVKDSQKSLKTKDVNVNSYYGLKNAIEEFEPTAEDSTLNITLTGNTYDFTTEMTINKTVIINANGKTLSTNGNYDIFSVQSGGHLTLENAIVKGCYNNYRGGAIYSYKSTLTIINCTFIDNNSTYYGGAVCARYTNLTVIDSTFTNNSARYGGAIYIQTETNAPVVVSLINNTYTNNNVTYYGGAVYLDGKANLTITGNQFINNKAKQWGGAFFTTYLNAIINITDSTFIGNNASNGGAIYDMQANNLTIRNSTFNSNSATSGGAIHNYGLSNITIINTTLTDNNASNGGAIYNYYSNSNIIVLNSTLKNNTAQYGGAIYVTYSNNLTINNSTLTNNYANVGGAIYGLQKSIIIVNDSLLTDNHAQNASIIYGVYANQTTLTNNTFINNTVTSTNGQVIVVHDNDTIKDNTYDGNEIETSIDIIQPAQTLINTPIQITLTVNETYDIKQFNGTITVYDNNEIISDFDVDSDDHLISHTYDYIATSSGNHNLTFVYSDKLNNYRVINQTITLTIIPKETFISITPINDTKINKTFTIETTLNDDDNNKLIRGNLTIIVDNQVIGILNVENSTVKIETSLNESKTYVVRVIYNDTSNCYLNNTTNTTINILKLDTAITVDSVTAKINESTVLKAYVYDENGNPVNGGKVAFKVNNITVTDTNGNPVYGTVVNGTAQITTSFNYKSNEYNLSAVYDETDYYNSINSGNVLLTINKLNTAITVDSITAKINESALLKAYVYDENGNPVNGGKVAFKVNGITVTDTKGTVLYGIVSNGTAQIGSSFNYKGREYNLSAVYGETDYYTSVRSGNSLLTLNKLGTSITVDSITAKINESTVLKAYVYDENGNPVNGGKVAFKVNGITVKDVDGNTLYGKVVNGTAQVTTIFNYKGKEYNLSAVYGETDYYTSVRSGNALLSLNKLGTAITVDSVTAKINESTVLRAYVYDENGNPVNGGKVAFKVNGITVTDTTGNTVYGTVVNGIAQINTSFNLQNKTYSISAVYSGNDYYDSVRGGNGSLVIKLRDAKINFDVPETANTGNEITLKITVKDDDKLLNNGKAVFKINGLTIKDSNNNPIYAYLNDGVAQITYKVPNLSSRNYTISAICSVPYYNRLETNQTITITKISA